MKNGTWIAVACSSLLAGCAGHASWEIEEGLAARKIEVQTDAAGRPVEIEYHLDVEAVPATVRAAMDELHPGGKAVAAEKEWNGSTLFWEVSKEIDGREVEAMFHPDGTLHSEEIEVAVGSVPEAVQEAVRKRMGAPATKWEEVRDGDRRLVEYHAKLTVDAKDYKVLVSSDGEVLGVYREIPAEIEAPVE